MTYIEPNGLLDNFITHLAINVTGSYFIPLLIIVLFLLVLALASGIPFEWTALVVFPLLVVGMAYDSNWGTYLAVIVIYMAALISKTFFMNR